MTIHKKHSDEYWLQQDEKFETVLNWFVALGGIATFLALLVFVLFLWSCTPVDVATLTETKQFTLTTDSISIAEMDSSLKITLTEPVCLVNSEKTKDISIEHLSGKDTGKDSTISQGLLSLVTGILGLVGMILF